MPTMNSGLGGPAGYGENVFSSATKASGNNDDGTVLVDVTSVFGPGGLTFFGVSYTEIYINSNGFISFGNPDDALNAYGIETITEPALVPFFSDISILEGGEIYWDIDTTNGRITITWDSVQPFGGGTANSFQVVITDLGGGDFTVEYIYEDITWTTVGGEVAVAGFTDGQTTDTEFDGSGNATEMAAYESNDFGGGDPVGTYLFAAPDGVIAGTSGNDTITLGYSDGDAETVSVVGDSIDGGAGNDSIDGDRGQDTILGGSGNDTLLSGSDAAIVWRTVVAGDDLHGSSEQDFYRYTGGADTSATVRFNNSVGPSDADGIADYLYVDTTANGISITVGDFDTGTDKIVLTEAYTGVSSTVFSPTNISFTITYASGNQQTFDIFHIGGAIADTNVFTLTLPTTTTNGDDSLSGGDDSDLFVISDSPGNDTIVGGEGGTDNDTIDASAMTVGVTVAYSGDEAGTLTDGTNTLSFSEIEELVLTAQSDSLDATSDSLGVDVDGGAGNDTLTGGTGNDSLDGGAGADSLVGGGGADTLNYAVGGDTLDGGDGDDDIRGGFSVGADDALLIGGSGNDTIVTYGANDTIYGGTGNDFINADSGDEYIDGGADNDTIFANSGADTVYGGAGDDSIETSGASTIYGGTGADTIETYNDQQIFFIEDGFGADTIAAGSSGVDQDTIDASLMTVGVTVVHSGNEAGTLTDGTDTLSFSEVEAFVLTAQNDSLDARNDSLGVDVDGGLGNDTIRSGDGNDTILAGDGVDSVYGGLGDDYFDLGAGDDYIDLDPNTVGPGLGNDTVIGGAGTDRLDIGDFNFPAPSYTAGVTGTITDAGFTFTNGTDTVTGTGVEEFLLTYAGDTIDASAATFDLFISGRDGSYNGTNDDVIIAGSGNDTIFSADGHAVITGGAGDDSISAINGNKLYLFEDGFGNDVIDDSTGINRADFSGLTTQSVTLTIDASNFGTLTSGSDGVAFDPWDVYVLSNNADSVDASLGTEELDIRGGGGDDTITGTQKGDVIEGGTGADSLDGGTGSDLIEGGAGNDTILAGGGNGLAYTFVRNADTVTGTTGADVFVWEATAGATSTITLDDGAGTSNDGDGAADYIQVLGDEATGTLVIHGFESGVDKIYLSGTLIDDDEGDIAVVDAAGVATFTVTYENGNTQTFEVHHDNGASLNRFSTFETAPFNDRAVAGLEADFIYGGDDADSFVVNDGFDGDRITGGEGGTDNDTIDASALTAGITATFTGNEAGTLSDGADTLAFEEIEGIVGTGQNDTIDARDVTSDQVFETGLGNDTINLGTGNDSVDAGGGDDFIEIDRDGDGPTRGSDTIIGGAGYDILDLGDFNYISGPDTGFTGTITDAGFTFVLGTDTITGSGVEAFRLTYGDDTVDASATTTGVVITTRYATFENTGEDSILGGSGNDTIGIGDGTVYVNAGAGNDSISAINGDKFILFSDGFGNDTIDASTDTDTVDFSGLSTQNITVTMTGGGNGLATSGTDSALFSSIAEFEKFLLSGNADSFDGSGSAEDFIVDGGAGADTLIGSGGSDYLSGGADGDSLVGGTGVDFLSGGAGDDTLDVGGGNSAASYTMVRDGDTVTGSTGADVFVWEATAGASGQITLDDGAGTTNDGDGAADIIQVLGDEATGTLVIHGFEAGVDRIHLSGRYTDYYNVADISAVQAAGVATFTVTYDNGNTQTFEVHHNNGATLNAFPAFTYRDDVAGLDIDVAQGGDDGDSFVVSDGFDGDTVIGGEGGTDFDVLDLRAVTTGVTVDWTASETGTVESGADTLTWSEIEQVILTNNADSLDASAETVAINVDGADGNDTLRGGTGGDTIYGGDGSDDLYGGAGNDSLIGGLGFDEYLFDDTWGNDTVTDTTTSSLDFGDVTTGITLAATGADAFSATDGANTVSGTTGTFSSIFLSQGNDHVDLSGMTANSIQYVYGNYTGATGTDTIIGSDLDDQVYVLGDNGVYFVQFGGGNDYIEATDQNDTIFGEDGNDTLRGFGGNDYLDGGDGDDQFYNSEGDNTLIGGAGNDWFFADDGSNQIWGGTGNDTIDAEDGDDTIFVEDGFGTDTITGGETVESRGDRLDFSAMALAGITVTYSSDEAGSATDGTDTLGYTQIEALTLTGRADSVDGALTTAGIEADGLAGNDTLTGGTGADTLAGGDGDDSIAGGDGADLLKSGQGTDTLDGGSGNDTLFNSAGDDSLVGGTGDDLLVASAGNDTLEGNAGLDTLMGGTDSDSLDGGADADLLLGDLAGIRFNETGTDGVGLAAGIGDFPATAVTYELTLASTDTSGDTSLGSYAVAGEDNEFSLQLQAGTLAVYVVGAFTNTGIAAATFLDGNINTLAVSWDSSSGALEVYMNGVNAYSGRTATGTVLDVGGTFALAQDQDTVGGGFDTPQALEGTIYGVRLYDDIRTPAEILDSARGPVADTTDPNLIANWVPDPDANTITDRTGSHTMTLSGDTSATWSADADTLIGGAGDDTLYGGGGADSFFGQGGADVLDGGDDADSFLIEDGFGADTITGGEGGVDQDTLDFSALTASVTVTFSGDEAGTATDGTDTVSFSEVERIIGTDQRDSIYGDGDAADTYIEARGGNDVVLAGDGNDTIDAGEGNDFVEVEQGDVGTYSIEGGLGNDTLQLDSDGVEGFDLTWTADYSGNFNFATGGQGSFTGVEYISGSSESDTIDASATTRNMNLYGSFGDDSIIGGAGNDDIDGEGGNDTVSGGAGNDLVDGSAGEDILTGGGGDDRFFYNVGDGNDTITDFNSGTTGTISDGDNTNNDFIDLSAFYDNLSELYADYADDGRLNQSNATDSKGRSVDYSDNTQFGAGDSLTFTGASADSSSFTVENTAVVCFASGTMIDTPFGERSIDALRPGDRVTLFGGGSASVTWADIRSLDTYTLACDPSLKPIELRAGALDAPRGLIVSPQHGLLVRLNGQERLVRAKHLADIRQPMVRRMHGCTAITYVHVALEGHGVLIANGRPAESFFPGPVALGALSEDARDRFRDACPDAPDWRPAHPYARRIEVLRNARRLEAVQRALDCV